MKLLPLLAFNYNMVFTFIEVKKVFLQLKEEAESENF